MVFLPSPIRTRPWLGSSRSSPIPRKGAAIDPAECREVNPAAETLTRTESPGAGARSPTGSRRRRARPYRRPGDDLPERQRGASEERERAGHERDEHESEADPERDPQGPPRARET